MTSDLKKTFTIIVMSRWLSCAVLTVVVCCEGRPACVLTIRIPERKATADATPILWASNSAASGLLEFRARGVGTSCSTTEPVIRLTTAKVPVPARGHCHKRHAGTQMTATETIPSFKFFLFIQSTFISIHKHHPSTSLTYIIFTFHFALCTKTNL